MRQATLVLLAMLLAGRAVLCAEPVPAPPAVPALPNGGFESSKPWDGWELTPAEPHESGRSEWERLAAEFTAPASGRVALELALDGSGHAEFDALELFEVSARVGLIAERRALKNPGFEDVGAKGTLPAGWELSESTVRVAAPSAVEGSACLRMELPKRGRAWARQALALEAGRCYLVAVRLRGEASAGAASLSIIGSVEGEGAKSEPLAVARLAGSTLGGGRGLCGRLVAARGAERLARIDCQAAPGRNCTLEMLARGDLGDRGLLKAEVYSLDDAGAETLLAAATLADGALGPDWRPLRVNFALRGARKVRVVLRLGGPATVEVDDVRLSGPRVVPAPRRLAAGDAEDNFRPKSRRPLVTSGGRRDAEMAAAFTALLGQSLGRPQSSWRFWRSAKPLEHQPLAFSALLARGLEPGTVYLLDPAGAEEAKWLAERAVNVPDRPGAYALAASAKEVVVAARSAEGFMAAASALGWLVSDGPEPEIFAGRIEDWPAHPFRAGALEFDGRLSAADRALLGSFGSWRLSHLVVTGPGLWRLGDSKARADARELSDAARDGTSGGLVAFLDSTGAAPELVRRSPQSAECVWHSGEGHYLRGTERSYLDGRNAVISAGAPVEIAAPDGKVLEDGRDYRLETAAPRWGLRPEEAPRSLIRRLPGGAVPDGGHVTANYNALPAPEEVPSACPKSEEVLPAFRSALVELGRLSPPAGVGLGGGFAVRMRTDKRTASTRFKNGRLLADRTAELCAEVGRSAPGAFPVMWADLVNPCGDFAFPEDSPTAAADLLDPQLRRRLVLLVKVAASDEESRERMIRSVAFLAERGYRVAGWAGASPAAVARAWVEAGAAKAAGVPAPAPASGPAAASPAVPAGPAAVKEPPVGEFAGMAIDLRAARVLDIEAFAEAAWTGAAAK